MSGGRSSLICCVGDGSGRVGKTLGRKPSRFPPKTEALAERSCRTAVLSGTAVERRTHPYTTKPSLGAPSLACAVGGGTCPDPMGGHPLHPPRDMPRGAHLAGQVTQSVPPATVRGPTCLAHALRAGRRYREADIRELLPRLLVGRARSARAPPSSLPGSASQRARSRSPRIGRRRQARLRSPGICELLPRLSAGRARPARAPPSFFRW